MSAASVTSNRRTTWPRMSSPRICCLGFGVSWAVGQLDAPGLAASAGLALRLDDARAAEVLRRALCVCRTQRQRSRRHRHAMLGEQLLGLVLEQVHALSLPLSFQLSFQLGRPSAVTPSRA